MSHSGLSSVPTISHVFEDYLRATAPNGMSLCRERGGHASSLDLLVNQMGSDPRLRAINDSDIDVVASGFQILPAIHTMRTLWANWSDLMERDPQAHRLHGFEGLARLWNPAEGKVMSASDAINYFRGRIDELDLEVMHQSIIFGGRLNDVRFKNKPGTALAIISTNVSQALLERRGFEADIMRLLEETKVESRLLVLELLETIREIPDYAIGALRALTKAGVKLAVDDYGRGSSVGILGQLKHKDIPVHQVKLDGADTARMDEKATCARVRELLKGVAPHIREVVWEGRWQGVRMSVIKAIRALHNDIGEPVASVFFEGTVVSHEFREGDADVGVDTMEFPDEGPKTTMLVDAVLSGCETDEQVATFIDSQMEDSESHLSVKK